MRSSKFFKRQKAKNGTGRLVKIKHILLPEEVANDLKLFKECYEICFSTSLDKDGNPVPTRVTFEQMIRRWIENIDRFDPDVAKLFEKAKCERQKDRERCAADLGLTPEQLQENEESYDPTGGEVWNLKYYFVKDEEEILASYGQNDPFYAYIDKRPKGMKDLMKDGWTLQNQFGVELDLQQAITIWKRVRNHLFPDSVDL